MNQEQIVAFAFRELIAIVGELTDQLMKMLKDDYEITAKYGDEISDMAERQEVRMEVVRKIAGEYRD